MPIISARNHDTTDERKKTKNRNKKEQERDHKIIVKE